MSPVDPKDQQLSDALERLAQAIGEQTRLSRVIQERDAEIERLKELVNDYRFEAGL